MAHYGDPIPLVPGDDWAVRVFTLDQAGQEVDFSDWTVTLASVTWLGGEIEVDADVSTAGSVLVSANETDTADLPYGKVSLLTIKAQSPGGEDRTIIAKEINGVRTLSATEATVQILGLQGIPGIRWRDDVNSGAWLTGTAYALNDGVYNDGSSYRAIAAHTSGASTEPGTGASWETVWELLALGTDPATAAAAIAAAADAEASKIAAAASATAAAGSATSAATSATSSGNSATSSANSASASSTSAGNSATSATGSANSAAASASSASAAATSAGNAATSEANAAASASAAATSVASYGYAFSTTTADADPGAGTIRLNNADPALATAAYVDNTDDTGGSITGILDSWDDAPNLVRGTLTIRSKSNPAIRRVYSVTGSVVDGTGYRKLTLAYSGGAGGFTNGMAVWLTFERAGNAGDGFLEWAASDETTAIAAGNGKLTTRFPYAFTATAIRASLSTAQTSGSIFTVDVKWWNGSAFVTILSTLITIDNTERSSVTAVTLPVLSKTSFADDDEFRIDVTQIGDGTAKGLKVKLLGQRT